MEEIYSVNLFSEKKENLQEFLKKFYNNNKLEVKKLKFEKNFQNPIDMIELISTLIDNNEKYPIAIWISIDKNIFIKITELNLNKIIKYLFERYPY